MQLGGNGNFVRDVFIGLPHNQYEKCITFCCLTIGEYFSLLENATNINESVDLRGSQRKWKLKSFTILKMKQ